MGIKSSPKKVVCALAVAAVLSGCASPYVQVAPPDSQRAYPPVSLPYAIEYSRTFHEAYRRKTIELGDSERNLSNGLITLGGVMVALAAAKTHSSTIGGVAILGGLAYTLGVFNTDKRRGLIYVAGMKALECANDAMSPLNFGDQTLGEFRVQMNDIKTSSSAVSRAVGETEAAIVLVSQQVPKADTAVQAARQAVTASRNAMSRAGKAYVAGNQVLLRHRQAGEQLRNAVDKIDAALVDELRGTEAAIQAVPGIISQLAQNSVPFSDLAKPAAAAPAVEGPHSRAIRAIESATDRKGDDRALLARLASSVATLQSETELMEARSQRLEGMVASVEASAPAERLKACKVEGVDTTMTLSPQVLTFDEKVPNTQMLVVKGGKPNYTAQFAQSSHPGLAIEASSPFLRSDVIAVTATKEALASSTSYQIVVRDSAAQVQFVTVNVVAKPTGGSNQPTGGSIPVDLASYIRTLSPLAVASGEVVTLTNVTLRPDGTPEVTYKPAAGKSVKGDEVVTALMSNSELPNLLGANRKPVAVPEVEAPHAKKVSAAGSSRFGSTVAALTRQDVASIQKNLCMTGADIDGVWGIQSQSRLIKDRERREAAGQKGVPEGFLTASEAKSLIERPVDDTARTCKG